MASLDSEDIAYEAEIIANLKVAKENDGYSIYHPTATPGLYVTAKPERLHGQVTVLRLGPDDEHYHVVWDSARPSVGHLSQQIDIPHYEAATRAPGATIRNHEVKDVLKIWYKAPQGPRTLVNIRNFTGEEQDALAEERTCFEATEYTGLRSGLSHGRKTGLQPKERGPRQTMELENLSGDQPETRAKERV